MERSIGFTSTTISDMWIVVVFVAALTAFMQATDKSKQNESYEFIEELKTNNNN